MLHEASIMLSFRPDNSHRQVRYLPPSIMECGKGRLMPTGVCRCLVERFDMNDTARGRRNMDEQLRIMPRVFPIVCVPSCTSYRAPMNKDKTRVRRSHCRNMELRKTRLENVVPSRSQSSWYVAALLRLRSINRCNSCDGLCPRNAGQSTRHVCKKGPRSVSPA